MSKQKTSWTSVPKDIASNPKLIFSLAKNDFKQKFAGSYLGIVWAFVQPIVTVFIYWFVFQKALNVGTQSTKAGIEAPYVLWLIAGIVPWFYFSEVINAGTNCMLEYSYLVKKVVFKISVLPVVKIISSLFTHVFFIAFMLLLYACYGYAPDLHMLQIIYYSFALIMLSMGIIYMTSAVVVFFKDLSQVVNIVLQVGIWATPIMWNIDGMKSVSPVLIDILKLNPLYYIVAGYRDAMLNGIWFWEKPGLTVYYWVITAIFFVLGTTIYSRLRPQFADVI